MTFARTEIDTINTMIRIDEGDNYTYNLQINTALKDVMAQSLSSSADQGGASDMADARMESRYDEILLAVKTLADQLTVEGAFAAVSSESKWQTKYNNIDTVVKAFALDSGTGPSRNRRRDPTTNTLSELYNQDDDATAVSVASEGLAKQLFTLTRYTFKRAKALAAANRAEIAEALTRGVDGRIAYGVADVGLQGEAYNPNPYAQLDPLYRARDVFLTTIARGNIIYGSRNGETHVRTSFSNTTKQIATTPIFPVSDEDGFEVYGSFAYGRGINIASYAALLQSAGDGDVIVGTGNTTSLQTLLAIEQFLASLKANPSDPTGALDSAAQFSGDAYDYVSPELVREDITRALAAQGLEITSDNQIVSIDERKPDETAAAAAMTGSPADSSSAEQSTLAANAPVELAILDPGTNEICACKGSEAAFFLQAFSGEYAKLDANEAVQTFLEDDVLNRGFTWEMGKEAMAGQIRDSTYTSMGERFQKMGGDYAALFSSTESALVSADEALRDINLADEIDQSIQDFEDAGLIVTPSDTSDE